MKADRLTYLIIMIVLLASCRDESRESTAITGEPVTAQAYVPEWLPPQTPSFILRGPDPPAEVYKPAFPDQQEQTIITVHRDTIQGIAVRMPGSIIYSQPGKRIDDREITETAFSDLGFVSTNSYVGVSFDNDIFNNTDYYYTNGIRIVYVSPIFAFSPFTYAMIPYKRSSMSYHGMSIVQNMYTPTNPDVTEVLSDDRPFAAYLYFGHFRNTLSLSRSYRQYSELVIGLIGPGSLGGFVQGQIHSIDPVGWENQIQNDLVLNYTVTIEKGLYNNRVFDINVIGTAQAGTLYDNAGAGIGLRAGSMSPYFAMPGLAAKNSAEGKYALKWQYGIFAKGKVRLALYNATLQGGMFNKTSRYTIPAEHIERVLIEASAGIFVAYRRIGIILEQYYLSPEFENAHHFRWGHINITYCF